MRDEERDFVLEEDIGIAGRRSTEVVEERDFWCFCSIRKLEYCKHHLHEMGGIFREGFKEGTQRAIER